MTPIRPSWHAWEQAVNMFGNAYKVDGRARGAARDGKVRLWDLLGCRRCCQLMADVWRHRLRWMAPAAEAARRRARAHH